MYDAAGNRIRKTEAQKETRYHYNQKNQLLKEENTEGINYFTYDKQGGIVKEKTSSGIRKFTYNNRHQQTRIETEDGRIQENKYDAEGLRYDLIENGKRTRFIYHNRELLYEKGEETKQSKEETSYQLGAGIEAFQRNKRTFYYHQDEQLNTALITNRKGEIKNPYQYDAFGNGLEIVEELSNRIRYTGQQYDQQTEQYYLRARYYNPIAGRFMQEDMYQGDGLNLYAYCRNNPVVYFDPSGYGKKYNNGLDEIPSVSEGFKKWFDTTDWREFDQIWKVKEQREYIESQIRAPRKLHEWLMAGRANTFKYWGVSMDEIKLNRDVISGLEFKNPHRFHGKKGSGTAHNKIKSIIDSSLNYDDYKRRLRAWADYRLPEIKINGITYPGSVRLPGNLQNQEAINYINRLHNEQTQEQNKHIIVEENDMKDNDLFYDEDGFLSLWLCNVHSEQLLQDYVNIDYEKVENDEIPFQLGCDFNISWYDEDFIEIAFEKNMTAWDLLKGHSYIDSIIPLLKKDYQEVMKENYNSTIIIYDLKDEGNVTEIKDEKYGYFKFIGTFKYSI